ncbi:polyhomeotic-like protein 3 [Megalops cyprinoides]|uniref:polyhomeotic-like protein 3 n=1 Tax=Megalops cyprinoides TaxID=118141 RepID=UPI001863DC8C|nr:polyhomeotic-like protein 3 [Megalops cyprinoides]
MLARRPATAGTLGQTPQQNPPPPQPLSVAQQTPVEETAPPVMHQVHEEKGLTKAAPITVPPPAGPEGNCRDISTDSYAAGMDQSCAGSKGTAASTSPAEIPHTNSSPTPVPPALVRSVSLPAQSSLPGGPENHPPQATVKPQILTHLVEGFVIQEGLEPFPVSRSSLMMDQVGKDLRGGGAGDSLTDTELPGNSTDTDLDFMAVEDGMEEDMEGVMHCEFCGKRSYTHTFLRSKRFCSTTCATRFNVSGTRRISALKANRTGRRRGRRPGRLGGGSREYFLRQLTAPYNSGSAGHTPRRSSQSLQGEEGEEVPSVPMRTRRRRQAELEREREQRARDASDSTETPPTSPSSPALWTVDQVCAFVYTLPGCQDIAEDFRSQEIDGQALLLLTEDHLMTAMNIRLGPALKICARINSLKGT